jgi:hypothetical protein
MQTETQQTITSQADTVEGMNRNAWVSGFTPQAELWNGRLAMIGFVSALAIELFTHKGVLEFWGIISKVVTPVL